MSTASSGADRAAMAEYLEGVLEEELSLSKSHVSSWGRVAMSAVDMDDAIKLMQVIIYRELSVNQSSVSSSSVYCFS